MERRISGLLAYRIVFCWRVPMPLHAEGSTPEQGTIEGKRPRALFIAAALLTTQFSPATMPRAAVQPAVERFHSGYVTTPARSEVLAVPRTRVSCTDQPWAAVAIPYFS